MKNLDEVLNNFSSTSKLSTSFLNIHYLRRSATSQFLLFIPNFDKKNIIPLCVFDKYDRVSSPFEFFVLESLKYINTNRSFNALFDVCLGKKDDRNLVKEDLSLYAALGLVYSRTEKKLLLFMTVDLGNSQLNIHLDKSILKPINKPVLNLYNRLFKLFGESPVVNFIWVEDILQVDPKVSVYNSYSFQEANNNNIVDDAITHGTFTDIKILLLQKAEKSLENFKGNLEFLQSESLKESGNEPKVVKHTNALVINDDLENIDDLFY